MGTFVVSLFAIVFFINVPAQAETVAKSNCSKEKEKRVIEIQRNPSVGGCVVFYTKFDVRKRVAQSRYAVTHCESVKSSIEQNLTGSGYACSEAQPGDVESEIAIQKQRNLEAWNSRGPASE
jgi:hypothetical protein